MKQYKILIFDLDDTLIDNTENIKHAFETMVSTRGEQYCEENFMRWYQIDIKFWKDRQDGLIVMPAHLEKETGKKSEEYVNWVRAQRVLIYFNQEITLEEAIELNYIYMEALKEKVVEIKDATETLQYLNDNYSIIVATNGPSVAAKDKLLKIQCLDYVDEVISADMVGYMKPSEEFFDEIMRVTNHHNRDDYLMIGDSLKSDVGFAMTCHFDSCWFNLHGVELEEKYQPTMVIDELCELREIL